MNQPRIEPPDVDLLQAARPNCYHVPRRFNLRAIMVLTAVIAAVCALLQRFNTPPRVYVAIAVMSGIAAAAQVFYPKSPRLASAFAIGGIFFVWATTISIYEIAPEIDQWGTLLTVLFYVPIIGLLFGLFLGYAFGTLTAGVFMLADWFSPTSMFNHDQNPQPPEKQPR